MLKQRNDKLTKKEELELGEKIQAMKQMKARIEAGYDNLNKKEENVISEGERALEQLVSNYYNLARSIAHKYHKKTGTRYNIEDLLQDAIFALVESAYAYDPTKNCRLSTYAYYGITKRVSTTINYQRLVRMPENKMAEYSIIAKAQRAYQELGEAEKEEYANELDYVYQNVGDLKESEVDLIIENMQPQVSLNAPIYDGDAELMDIIEDDRELEARTLQLNDLDKNLINIVRKLNDYELDLVAFEFGVFPASMPYSDFLKKYDITDKKVKFETRKVIRKMTKFAEESEE